MTSLLAPASSDNKETGNPSSNRNFTHRSLNSTPYRFPYRLPFLLPFFLTPPTFSMGTLLSPFQECHPFYPSPLYYDLVVSPLFGLGIIQFHHLSIEVYPDVANNYAWIITQWPGRAAEEIEQQVTIPIENVMSGIPYRTYLRSVTIAGLSVIIL